MHRLFPRIDKFIPVNLIGYPRVKDTITPSYGYDEKSYNYLRHHTISPNLIYSWGVGSSVLRTDGKYLTTYADMTNRKINCSIVPVFSNYYMFDNCCKDGIGDIPAVEYEFCSIDPNSILSGVRLDSRSKLKRLANGDLLLFVYDPGARNVVNQINVYKSISGNGDNAADWIHLSDVYVGSSTIKSSDLGDDLAEISPITQLSTGRIIFWNGRKYNTTSWCYWHNVISYSDDNGATWTNVQLSTSTNGVTYGIPGSGVCECSNYEFTIISKDFGGLYKPYLVYSSDGWATYDICDSYNPGGFTNRFFKVFDVGDKIISIVSIDDAGREYNIYYVDKPFNLPVSGNDGYNFLKSNLLHSTTYGNEALESLRTSFEYMGDNKYFHYVKDNSYSLGGFTKSASRLRIHSKVNI